MFKLVIVAVVIAVCSAFVPAQVRSSSLRMMAERSKSVPFLNEPVNLKGMPGYKGFDPIGLSDSLNPLFLAEAEIKHSRIAMLAVLGFVITDLGVRLPGSVHDVSSVAAHNVAVSSGSAFQLLSVIAGLEFIHCVAVKQMLEGSGRAPGEFGFDPLGFSKGKSQAEKDSLAAKEIENGRAAMLAFAGIVTQAALFPEKGFPYF